MLLANNFIFANTDSLITKLENAKKGNNVEGQLELLLKLGNEFNSNQQFTEAIAYYNQGLSLSEKNEFKAQFLNKIGQVFVDSANYNEALKYLNQSVEIYNTITPNSEFANTYSLIGMCYGLTSNLDEALVAFRNALEVNFQIKDSSGIGVSFYNIGLVYQFKGVYEKAVGNYIKSLEIREAIKDTSAIITSLISIGETFRLRDDCEKAMKYYNQALQYKENLENVKAQGKQLLKNKEILAYIYSEVGLIHEKEENYEIALLYFDTAMVYSQEINYKRGIATIYRYQANIEKLLGCIDKSKELHKKSLDAYRNINHELGIIQALTSIAEIEINNRNYLKSLTLLDSARRGAVSNGLLEEQVEILRLRIVANRGLGKTDIALDDYDSYIFMKDSLFNVVKEKQIEEIETKFQTEKKEKQIELLNKETTFQRQKLRTQKLIIYFVIIIVLFVIIIGVLFLRQNKLKSKLEVEQNKQKLLRSQMNPHFIYNSLSAIQNFILSNNSMESVTYISEFSSLMRMVLENSRKDLISLKDDVDFVNYYLKLQKLRFSDKFDFEINIDENINPEIIKIPPMLTQPFIENAVEHGVRQMRKNGLIRVNYQIEGEKLLISIIDNGVGLSSNEKTEKNHKSLATIITKERIENISQLLKIKIKMEISEAFPEKENKGLKVVFIIHQ